MKSFSVLLFGIRPRVLFAHCAVSCLMLSGLLLTQACRQDAKGGECGSHASAVASCDRLSPDQACRDDRCRSSVVTGCAGYTHKLEQLLPPRCESNDDCCEGNQCVEIHLEECCPLPEGQSAPAPIKVCWPRRDADAG